MHLYIFIYSLPSMSMNSFVSLLASSIKRTAILFLLKASDNVIISQFDDLKIIASSNRYYLFQ